MDTQRCRRGFVAAVCLTAALTVLVARGEPGPVAAPVDTGRVWARSNLHAWEIANFDLMKRSPDERARMLKQLGIVHYAYLSRADPYGREADVSTSQLDIDAEIAAMLKHG